jgi:hypothetical protein
MKPQACGTTSLLQAYPALGWATHSMDTSADIRKPAPAAQTFELQQRQHSSLIASMIALMITDDLISHKAC